MYLERVQVSLASYVNVKHLLGIPYQTTQVDRQSNLLCTCSRERNKKKGKGRQQPTRIIAKR